MSDAFGHPLAVGDIVHPDNTSEMILRINSYDGTLATCIFKDAASGPTIKYLPSHLVWISTPTS